MTASVAKGVDTNWKYFSFKTNGEVNYEPPNNECDLYFGRVYMEMDIRGLQPAGKIIPNVGNGVQVAKADSVELDDLEVSAWAGKLETDS